MKLSRRKQGFTIVELLSVMAIITILSSLSLSMVTSMVRSQDVTSGLQTIGGVLDQSRQYSISKNTYVWVVFKVPAAGEPQDHARVVVLSSKTGSSFSWDYLNSKPTVSGFGSASDLEITGKVQDLGSVRFSDKPTVSISALPSDPSVSLATVDIDILVGGTTQTFTKAIQFTPTGEARMGESFNRYIDITMLPALKSGGADSPNQAVVRVAGLTGKTSIFRN